MNAQTYCDDLYSYACGDDSPKVVYDGTGISGFQNIRVDAKEIFEDQKTRFAERFKQLDLSNSKAFRRAYGPAMTKCDQPGDSREFCDRIDEGKIKLIARKIFQAESEFSRTSMYGLASAKDKVDDVSLSGISIFRFLWSKPVRKLLKEVDKEIQKKLVTPSKLSKVRAIFNSSIKVSSIETIERFFPPGKNRDRTIKKLKEIQLDFKDCPNGFSRRIAYDPSISNKVIVCNSALSAMDSDFSILYTIGHEVAHAFDPCSFPSGKFPLPLVSSCLRSEKSVGASNFDHLTETTLPRFFYKATTFAQGMSDCASDQIGEAFSDWFAAEILAKSVSTNRLSSIDLKPENFRDGFANAAKAVCTNDTGSANTIHPMSERRVNSILLVHPVIRGKMGCSPSHPRYVRCDNRPMDELVQPTHLENGVEK